ncbi:hypothetical protein F4678DRAFT_473071 [Xylaria arbuscula]|nr:hypothetical protein F4678DRAFT_473071 [Xylaria arbuscula]
MEHEKVDTRESHKQSNAQSSSLFFSRLPQEMRDEIYRQVFTATRLTYTYTIGDTWLRHVLFNFGDPIEMYRKLIFLPIDIVSKIRYIRISGLQLDRLTIISDELSSSAYCEVSRLIKFCDGWKELHYIHYTLDMLGFAPRGWMPTIYRKPQPSHWQQRLEDRDTKLAKPLIAIYQSTKPGVVGSATDPETEVILEQTIHPGQTHNDCCMDHDPDLDDYYHNKEILIIVKRGIDADYKQKVIPTPDVVRAQCDIDYKPPNVDVYLAPYEYDWSFHDHY